MSDANQLQTVLASEKTIFRAWRKKAMTPAPHFGSSDGYQDR
jgi:hypothetical protein